MDANLYQEIILDHVNHPRNFGTLQSATHTSRDSNASCGDMVEFQLVLRGDVVTEIAWRGVGCAISTAAASMLSEMVKGKSVADLQTIREKDLMQAMGLTEILPTREKCLVLPLRVLHKAFAH